MIQEWLNSPGMQESIRLFRTPHFLFFFFVSVVFAFAMYRMGAKKSINAQRLSGEERDEFRTKYLKQKDRAEMPTKFNDYAAEIDQKSRTFYCWIALNIFASLVLFYKLLELYAL